MQAGWLAKDVDYPFGEKGVQRVTLVPVHLFLLITLLSRCHRSPRGLRSSGDPGAVPIGRDGVVDLRSREKVRRKASSTAEGRREKNSPVVTCLMYPEGCTLSMVGPIGGVRALPSSEPRQLLWR